MAIGAHVRTAFIFFVERSIQGAVLTEDIIAGDAEICYYSIEGGFSDSLAALLGAVSYDML